MLLNINLFSIEIIERNENNVKVKIDNAEKITYKLFELKNGKVIDKSSARNVILSIKDNAINSLSSGTKYIIEDSKGNKTEFWTLAEEPKKAKTNIMFQKTVANSIKGRVSIKDADGVYLLISTDENLSILQDGKEYSTGKYGENKNKIGNSFVIKKMKNGEDFILENLKYAIYNFKLIPFNGNDESINYFSEKGDIRKNHPQLDIPKAKECEFFKENIANIGWNKVEGTQYYEVSVAEDANFNTIIEEYNGANFNNGTNFKLFLEDESKKYYWKIKAVGIYNSSEYSGLNVIDYDYINSAKK